MQKIAHMICQRVDVPSSLAFDFLRNPTALGRWSLGCMNLQPVDAGIWCGHSLFDGAPGWLTIDADRQRLLIDYHVGTLDRRQPRISVRVTPGPVCGLPDGCCLVTLSAWRTAEMSDERWSRLCATHDAEIWLIKAQAEAQHSADAA